MVEAFETRWPVQHQLRSEVEWKFWRTHASSGGVDYVFNCTVELTAKQTWRPVVHTVSLMLVVTNRSTNFEVIGLTRRLVFTSFLPDVFGIKRTARDSGKGIQRDASPSGRQMAGSYLNRVGLFAGILLNWLLTTFTHFTYICRSPAHNHPFP